MHRYLHIFEIANYYFNLMILIGEHSSQISRVKGKLGHTSCLRALDDLINGIAYPIDHDKYLIFP